MTPLQRVEVEGFSILSEAGDDTLTVKLNGSLDASTVPLLDSYLSVLHREALQHGLREVVFDCENLYFLNSLSIKRLVTWLSDIKKLETGERYCVAFRTNRRLAWQRRSFDAVRRFASNLVRVET